MGCIAEQEDPSGRIAFGYDFASRPYQCGEHLEVEITADETANQRLGFRPIERRPIDGLRQLEPPDRSAVDRQDACPASFRSDRLIKPGPLVVYVQQLVAAKYDVGKV